MSRMGDLEGIQQASQEAVACQPDAWQPACISCHMSPDAAAATAAVAAFSASIRNSGLDNFFQKKTRFLGFQKT